jgi:hypothetical protein
VDALRPPSPQKKDNEGAVVDPAPAPAAKKNRSTDNQLTEDDYDASEADCEVVKLSLWVRVGVKDVDTVTCLLMHIGEETVPVGCLLESVYIRASHLHFYSRLIKEQYANNARCTDQQQKNNIKVVVNVVVVVVGVVIAVVLVAVLVYVPATVVTTTTTLQQGNDLQGINLQRMIMMQVRVIVRWTATRS